MTKRDDELLEEARGGSARALDELLARWEKPIYRFGLRMCGDEEAAKEVLQETLLAAFRHLRSFRGEAGLSTWLYQVARRSCGRSRRRRVGEPPSHEALDAPGVPEAPAPGEGSDERVHAREVAQILEAALLALSPEQREAIVLRDVEGLAVEEAAGVTGLAVPAFKSRLHRARLTMRRHVGSLFEASASPCPELRQELAAEERDIDQAACARIEAHLARCPACRGACEDLERTVALCRRLPGDEVPPPIRRAIRRALAEEAARS